MFSLIGILVVIGSVLGGFLMEKGKLPVLVQPAEFLTIAGAALGTVLAANPMHVLKGVGTGVLGVLKSGGVSEKRYTETLKMLFDVFSKARKEGLVAVEADIEEPEKSSIFSKYPDFLKGSSRVGFCMRHHAHGCNRRGEAVRRGPDDGAGLGGPPSHIHVAHAGFDVHG